MHKEACDSHRMHSHGVLAASGESLQTPPTLTLIRHPVIRYSIALSTKSENLLFEVDSTAKAASCGARGVRARRLPTNLLRKTSTQGTRAKQPPHVGRLQSRSSSRCKHHHPLIFPRRRCFGHGKASGRCCEAALLSKRDT